MTIFNYLQETPVRPLYCKSKGNHNGPEEDSGYLLTGISFGDMVTHIGDHAVFSRLQSTQNNWISDVVQERKRPLADYDLETDRTMKSGGFAEGGVSLIVLHFSIFSLDFICPF